MSLALGAIGTLFKIETATPGTFVTIPEMRKCGAPNVKFDLLDVTSHDSAGGFREYIPGLADGQNATGEVNWVPSNTVHIQLRTDAYAKNKKLFKMIFPGGGTGAEMDFTGYITDLNPQADAGAILMETVQIKVTGLPTWV